MTPTPTPTRTPAVAAAASAKKRVLIVDGSAELRAIIRNRLERDERFEVIAEAPDGVRAVELVAAQRPDLVILDLSTADGDGMATLLRIRSGTPGTRVVVYSAFPRDQFAQAALAAGASGYVEKDGRIAELIHALDVAEDAPVPELVERGEVPTLASAEASPSQDRERPRRRWGRLRPSVRGWTIIAVGLMIAALALGLVSTQMSARTFLRSASVNRAELGARLISDDIQRTAKLAQDAAISALTGEVDLETVRTVASASGSPDVFMLLAGDGSVLQVWPERPELIGADIRDRFAHLAGASAGQITVSDMVASAVDGRPLAALAVPFPAEDGNRVLSLLLEPEERSYRSIASSSLGATAEQVHVVDGAGALVLPWGATQALTPLSDTDPIAAEVLGSGAHQVTRDGNLYTVAEIAGTRWKLLAIVPEVVLYAPLEGWLSTLPWMIVAATVGLGIVSYFLYGRLGRESASLRLANEELRRSNEDLEQFAYVASHDLQEPLRKVASYCQLLQRRYTGRLDDDADEFIGYAVDGASRLQQLIADLLEFSRAGRGLESVPHRVVDLDATAREVVDALSDRAAAEGGEVVVLGSLPAVLAERSTLHRILQNLVSNALKFHGEDPPEVTISARIDGPRVHVDVSDNGIGISHEDADRVFGIFQRLHTRERYEGTGIGLAIVRKLVDRLGGEIAIVETSGPGTTFRITLRSTDQGVAR